MDATRPREAAYEELFGSYQAAYLPDFELVGEEAAPQPTIYVYERDFGEGPFRTLVTGGMSDRRMHLPSDLPGEVPHRAELLLYVHDLKDEYVSLLRWLARFPFLDETWLGFGHTVMLGEPLFEGSELQHLLLLTSIVSPDKRLPERLSIDGDAVELLWVVPITPAEREHKIEHGVNSLLDLFEENGHPWVLDESRASYV